MIVHRSHVTIASTFECIRRVVHRCSLKTETFTQTDRPNTGSMEDVHSSIHEWKLRRSKYMDFLIVLDAFLQESILDSFCVFQFCICTVMFPQTGAAVQAGGGDAMRNSSVILSFLFPPQPSPWLHIFF